MVAQLEKPTTTTEAPIERVLSLLRHPRSYSRGYTAHCPGAVHGNGDSTPSLMVWENTDGSVGLKCHTGCSRKDICQALNITEQDLYPADGRYRPKMPARTLDVLDLALDKYIDIRFLYKWGLDDGYTWHTPRGKEWKNVVRIPYYNLDGSEYSRARIRTATKASASKSSQWEGTGDMIPYGLNRLKDTANDLVLVEGESDCWTLWQWGFSALGIPGANNAQCLQQEHVDLFPAHVYIVKEPSTPGKPPAGEQFVTSLTARLRALGYRGEIYQLDLYASHRVKDPNDLNKLVFKEERPRDFTTEWRKALDAAVKLDEAEVYLPQIIVVGRQYRDVSQEALSALHDGNRLNPMIFVKEGRLVQLTRDEKKNPVVRQMAIPEIRNALTNTADYFKVKAVPKADRENPDENEVQLVPISPPKELAEYILAMDPIEWPFPALAGIVEMPIMRPDGSILDTPGYDTVTRLYYVNNDQMKDCKIPERPTGDQITQAVSLIHASIGEFFYETQADYANMFGLLVTLVTRYMYDGDVMTALLNATKQGTGKSLLAQFACVLATGRPPAMTSFPEKEEETKKVIDAKVLSGNTLIVFDNIKRTFESAALDMLTTCRGWYSVRPLGKTQDIAVHTQVTVIATGNNIQLDTDQARRCYQIRLVSPVSNPDERTDITIKDLVKHAMDHRAELVAALLTLARAWYVDGQPNATNKLAQSASSYSHWCNVVGGILENAGITGFQENRDTLKAEVNSEEQQIFTFLHAWQKEFGNEYIPAVRLVKLIKNAALAEEDTQTHPLFETLPDHLKNAFFEREKSITSCTVIFSKWLARRVKTPYGTDNIRIEHIEDTHKCQKLWRVHSPNGWNSPIPDPSQSKTDETPGIQLEIQEAQPSTETHLEAHSKAVEVSQEIQPNTGMHQEAHHEVARPAQKTPAAEPVAKSDGHVAQPIPAQSTKTVASGHPQQAEPLITSSHQAASPSVNSEGGGTWEIEI